MPEGHPHQLRDTFACDLLTKGVPLEELVCGIGSSGYIFEQFGS
jgi:site-specific recombinase XerD